MPDDSGGNVSSTSSMADPVNDLALYLQQLQTHVQKLTMSAAQLPGPSDLSFHRSLDRKLERDLEETKKEVMATLNDLLRINDDVKQTQVLSDRDVVDPTKFERNFGDVIDTLLERTAMRLEEYAGRIPVQSSRRRVTQNPSVGSSVPSGGPLPGYILNAPIKPLPQDRFSRKPDNSRDRHWRHFLREKPNSLVPLSWQAPDDDGADEEQVVGQRRGMYCAEGDPRENPYYYEIRQFEPPTHALEVPLIEDLVAPPPLSKDEPASGPTPYSWVADQQTFKDLCDHLQEDRVKEIAVDVEHHNFRSYQGLVCLVQISTRWQDFIIDALEPTIRDNAYKLNQSFTDPAKVKILHGAEHDILWLQRDLGVYIVGLFDTYHATNVLNFSQHGLAYLLNRYIDFIADKRYQLADWRIRPLPKEMLYYARSDTHTLVHVYDCLRFEIEKTEGLAGIQVVFELSKKTAAKTYALEDWNDDAEGREGWRSMWRKLAGEEALTTDARFEREGIMGLTFTERLFRALHDWRDRVARNEDESARYILNSANLLNLASRAPDSRESVQACIGTGLKKRSAELVRLIEAEKKSFEEAKKSQTARQRGLLEKAASGSAVLEEIGDVVRVEDGADGVLALWPVDDTLAGESSTLARHLFDRANAPSIEVAAKKKAASLFVPTSQSAANQRLIDNIQSGIAISLDGITGRGLQATMSGSDSGLNNPASLLDESQKLAQSSEAVDEASPSVPKDSAPEQATTRADESVDADGIIQVRRKKEKKGKPKEAKEAAQQPNAGSPTEMDVKTKEGKKRKWTKEEKAERKRRLQEEREAVVPFDYSTVTSVLDNADSTKGGSGQKQPKTAKNDRKSRKDGLAAAAAKNETTLQINPSRRGRYSDVGHGRDRKEQAGGRSMTFSR